MPRQSSGRTAVDVPDIVHAGLKRDESDGFEPIPDLRNVLDSESAQLNLLARRDVGKTRPELPTDGGDRPHLAGLTQAVGHPQAHHEMPGRLAAKEHTCPFQPFAIAILNRFPAGLREPRHVLDDVQAVFLFLVALDLVQGDDDIGAGSGAIRTSAGMRACTSMGAANWRSRGWPEPVVGTCRTPCRRGSRR